MSLVLLLGGLALLLVGGEALVRGTVGLGRAARLSPLFVGMVIAGFGTSMPEMVVSVTATLDGRAGIAVGNVVGSNIANILLILGIAALIRPIGRPDGLFRPDGAILVAVTVGVVLLGMQGVIPAWQGAVLIVVLAAYLAMQYRRDRRATSAGAAVNGSIGGTAGDGAPLPLPEELPARPLVAALMALAGLGTLLAGAHFFVEGAVDIARLLGVGEAVIGLTVVALGTSLPELATTAVAAARGQQDIAYGNIVGSNLFNLLAILGAATFAGRLEFPGIMVLLDGPVMIAATLAMILFLWTGARLSRIEGGLLVGAYTAYIAVRYLAVTA